MLKVTDMNLLPLYGFEKRGTNNSGRDIWTLDIDEGLSLTVNPVQYDKPETEGEIEMWGEMDIRYKDAAESFKKYGSCNVTYDVPCETLFRLIVDGVVTLAGEKKEVAA